MRIFAEIPESVKGFRYVRNHHFLELEDIKGNSVKLNASGVLIGDCQECKAKCLALSRMGEMRCTHCGGSVKWLWTKPQLAFVPESESSFMGFEPGTPKED